MKSEMIPLALIDNDFDVREKTLFDGHGDVLANLRLEGTVLPPITVYKKDNGRYSVIDGRHRLYAAERIGDKNISATVVPEGTKVERLKLGFNANFGGSLPPTKAEMVLLCVRLYDAGLKAWEIAAAFPSAKRYMNYARRDITMRQINLAIQEIRNNPKISMADAAEKWGCTVTALQGALKGGDSEAQKYTPGKLRNAFNGFWTKFSYPSGKLFGNLTTLVSSGKVSKALALEIVDHEEDKLKSAMRINKDRRMRIEQI